MFFHVKCKIRTKTPKVASRQLAIFSLKGIRAKKTAIISVIQTQQSFLCRLKRNFSKLLRSRQNTTLNQEIVVTQFLSPCSTLRIFALRHRIFIIISLLIVCLCWASIINQNGRKQFFQKFENPPFIVLCLFLRNILIIDS